MQCSRNIGIEIYNRLQVPFLSRWFLIFLVLRHHCPFTELLFQVLQC
jgi:hypothetical protein